MSASPIVSVVIPAYNHERYVAAAIGSVVGQTFADFELLVLDDASGDATWDIVSGFSDSRIRAVRHQVNLGAHATLNEGIHAAQGRFVAVLNSDDLFAPRRLEALVEAARQAGDREMFAFSDVDLIDAEGTPIPAHPRALAHARLCKRCSVLPPALWFFTGNPALGTSNYFFSKSLFQATGPFAPLRYTHDWDWALRAAQRCPPTWMHEALLSYRVHDLNTLAEDDAWRHVHENSLVQATALMRLPERPSRVLKSPSPDEVCLAILRNESLHPVALLCLLITYLSGASESGIRDLSTQHDGVWPLASIAEAAGYPYELFRASPYLIEMKAGLASQAALIEQRWTAIQNMSEEIANRDRWIADLQDAVAERDQQIASLQSRLEISINALRISDERLAAHHASRLVRAALYLGRVLRRIGIRQDDPRLR